MPRSCSERDLLKHLIQDWLVRSLGIRAWNGKKGDWDTDFYTPPVLRGDAFFDNSAPAAHKNPIP